ncbi:helix-turn-helix domain-containing protein [uncultured Enterococcus sp.]|uniref:helix-turn-helix domain-containing protein n=1 Tax=uncultured Enterococcus sp. TaxID=167972 RepID=UPI00258A2ADB|nr:helix-turn-helix domain-containing protein [uncultured Enterococcus sp.]
MTKNIMNELAVQEKLQKLNFEVLCSTSIFEMILRNDYTWGPEFYQVIILSETITNKELEGIVPKLKEKKKTVFRKYLDEVHPEEEEELAYLEMDTWLSEDIPSNLLREVISKGGASTEQQQKFIIDSLDHLLMDFTKTETSLFKYLYKSDATFVSREDLCWHIWDTHPTNSKLAHLSVLVNSIRRKLIQKGFPPNTVETVWRKGYHLTKDFYAIYRDIQY